jgi:hypothetical protein
MWKRSGVAKIIFHSLHGGMYEWVERDIGGKNLTSSSLLASCMIGSFLFPNSK